MWAAYLMPQRGLFTAEYPFLGFGPLATLTVEAGIDDALWRKSDEISAVFDDAEPSDQLLLFDL